MTNYKPEHLGVMIDMSRNSVMNMDSLKRFLTLLKKMGYNTAMLYTEDTYEIEGEPHFGYMRGKYSIEEMQEIDTFAASIGIEMIPCVQTLAHLATFLRWRTIPKDTDNILLVDEERTYQFIDRMFSTLSKCFRSKKIHIGMDEAHELGKGNFLKKHAPEEPYSILSRHLKKVTEIAQKYGLEPMIWSDMYFRCWNKGEYYIPKTEIPEEIVEAYPKNVIPVYWDYYHTDIENYKNMFDNHAQLSDKTWFGGGIWSWSGMIPINTKSLNTMRPALDACRNKNIRNIFFTMWGDNGGECSHFAQLPVLCYLAEYAKGNRDEASIKAKFRRITGIDYDDFMKIDLPNNIDNKPGFVNPSKYLLYSDCFNGFLDGTVIPGIGELYRKYAEELRLIAKKTRRYGYLFDSAAKLCDILEYKAELGIKTRAAYQAGDKATLKTLAEKDYKEIEKRLRIFHAAFEKQWFIDNKPHGFDVEDLRLGGSIQRIISCRKRISDYVSEKISSIPELTENILPYQNVDKGTLNFNNYAQNVTVNVM